MNGINREKVRENEYNIKLKRISQLEEELRSNLEELKNKQHNIEVREKDLNDKNEKMKDRETRLKTLVEDEKRRSASTMQANSKEFRKEIERLKEENRLLEQKRVDVERYEKEAKTTKKQFEDNLTLVKNVKSKNEELVQKIAELEAKSEQSLKAQDFYKTALANAEMKVQHLVEENNRNKSAQILDQKEEIQRLRSELVIVTQKNEAKLANVAMLGPQNLSSRTEPGSITPMPSISSTASEATTVIPAAVHNKVAENPSNGNDFRFGKHPVSRDKQFIDLNEHISMLQKEKAMFLKTKVYTEQDPIVMQLNHKINGLLKIKQQQSS